MNHSVRELEHSKVLILASTGGHLAQASRWIDLLAFSEDSLTVTFESPQSESLMAKRRHQFISYIPPRDVFKIIRGSVAVLRIVRREKFDAVVSTGAGIAFCGLIPALFRRIPMYYIESVSRPGGPSFTGKILSRLPWIRRFTQHPGPNYPEASWTAAPSLLMAYRSETATRPPSGKLKVFITLGTIRPYRFDRLVESVLTLFDPDETDFLWQLGVTHRTDLPGDSSDYMDAAEFDAAVSSSDLVVTHAGAGTLIGLLDAGVRPLVMARLSEHGEHVDDHQTQIAKLLESADLVTRIESLSSTEHLASVVSRRVVRA